MIPKKIFFAAVMLSLAGHIAFLALSGHLGDNDAREKKDVFSVSLVRNMNKPGEKYNYEDKTTPDSLKKSGRTVQNGAMDTIDLDSTDTKYYPYLVQVRENINRTWSYPEDAFIQGQMGTTVVEFSIIKKGTLTDSHIITSSGHKLLDRESLLAISSAAPFESFPAEFGLAKLNIVASFRYTLGD